MYWELLSFYKLFPCTEDFVNVYEFPPVPGTLNFYDFPPVLETWVFYEIYFSMYSGLTNISSYTGTLYFYWFPHALRTLNFYDFPLVLKTFFTVFPMYWRLWGFTNFPILKALSFYWFHSALGTMIFYLFPCIENFVFFYEISHIMGTLNFYKLSPYTEWGLWISTNLAALGTLRFYDFPLYERLFLTNFPMYWELDLLRIFLCIGDFVLYKAFLVLGLWVFTAFPPVSKTLSLNENNPYLDKDFPMCWRLYVFQFARAS